ncbi:pyridoxamine 5'-phosphate oxidase family protein [bacterium]|nr:pyridoxamine 5'-phosphate oxidase family protein [bacterium]
MSESFHNVPMRNQQRSVKDDAAMMDVLSGAQYVVIAMCQENQPYVITLSCGLDRGKRALYFHTAIKGLKLDIMDKNARVSFTAIDDLGYQYKKCSHKFRSVVGFGTLVRVTDRDEMRHGFEVLMDHLEPEPDPLKKKFLDKESIYQKTVMLRLDIENMTGKESLK